MEAEEGGFKPYRAAVCFGVASRLGASVAGLAPAGREMSAFMHLSLIHI